MGAGQISWQKGRGERFTEGSLGWLGVGTEQAGAAAEGLVQGRGMEVFSQASLSAWKEAARGDFFHRNGPPAGALVPVTGPLWASASHMK